MATRLLKKGHKSHISVSKKTRKNNLKCQRQADLAGTKPLINPEGVRIITGTDIKRDGRKIRKFNKAKAKEKEASTSLLSDANRKKMKRLDNIASPAEEQRGLKRTRKDIGAPSPENKKPRTIVIRKIRRVNLNSLCYISMVRRVRPEGEEDDPASLLRRLRGSRQDQNIAGSSSDEGEEGKGGEEMDVQTVFEDYESFRGDADIGLTNQLDAHAKANPGVSPSKQTIPTELIAAADKVRHTPGDIDTIRTETTLEDGTRVIEELQNVHLQTIMIGLDFFSVRISDRAFEWALQKDIHTNDLSRGVAALIRNASTSVMTVFGIDYNSMRTALGLGAAEIHNILNRALPFSLGIPEDLMSMWQVSQSRHRIRVIPIWVMISFLSSLPRHIYTLNDNPLKSTLTAYNQMLGLRWGDIGAHKISLARYLKILEYAMHQYEDGLRKLAKEGVLRTDEYGKFFSDVKVSIMNLQSTSETTFIESRLLSEHIDRLEQRLEDQQKLIDGLKESRDIEISRIVKAKFAEHEARLKEEIRAELIEEFRNMFFQNARRPPFRKNTTTPYSPFG